MGLSEKLIDINNDVTSLLTYINGVTGTEDASLGDAVRTLAEGYGKGGGTVWETVVDTTLSEAQSTYSYSFSTPVKKVRMLVYPNAASNGWKRFEVNGVNVPWDNSNMQDREACIFEYDCNAENGYYAKCVRAIYRNQETYGLNFVCGISLGPYSGVTDIKRIGCASSGMLVAGAKIKIECVR